MTSVDEIRDLLAAVALSTMQTRDAVRALGVTIGVNTTVDLEQVQRLFCRLGTGPAVVTALQTVQIVRKSSESDEQYTVSETDAPVGAASPTNTVAWMLGIDVTYIRLMEGKLALSTLYAIDVLDTAVARLGTVVESLGIDVAPPSTAAQRGTAVVPLVESLGIDVAPLNTTVALLCTVVPPLKPPFEPPPPEPPPPEPPPPEPMPVAPLDIVER